MPEQLNVVGVTSLPFAEVSYVVSRPDSRECLVVDPGFEPEKIFAVLDDRELDVAAILNTHGHVDHIAGNQAMKDRFPTAPLIIGVGDAPMLSDPFLNLSALGGTSVTSPPADHLVHDGQTLKAIGQDWEVREIPGHSPGHVVYVWHDGSPPVVLGGDVLFSNGIGRFDFPGGDGRLLVEGIRQKLYTLPGETIVYPGHGPATTIDQERENNPFTRGSVPLL